MSNRPETVCSLTLQNDGEPVLDIPVRALAHAGFAAITIEGLSVDVPTQLAVQDDEGKWHWLGEKSVAPAIVTGFATAFDIPLEESDPVRDDLTRRIDELGADKPSIVGEAFGKGYLLSKREGKYFFRKQKSE